MLGLRAELDEGRVVCDGAGDWGGRCLVIKQNKYHHAPLLMGDCLQAVWGFLARAMNLWLHKSMSTQL